MFIQNNLLTQTQNDSTADPALWGAEEANMRYLTNKRSMKLNKD